MSKADKGWYSQKRDNLIIKKQMHGFTVSTNTHETGYPTVTWAFSSLEEALNGVKQLMDYREVNHD